MIQRRAFTFRLEPDGAQRRALAQCAGARRWVWNQALTENKRRLEAGERTASYAEMCRWITAWRHSEATSWLAELPSSPLQQGVRDLYRAIKDYFRSAGDAAKKAFPRFKRKGVGDTIRFPIDVKAETSADGRTRVRLAKIGWVYYRASRPIVGRIAQATVYREGEHWFVCILTDREMAEPAKSDLPAVGIDLGVVRFATLSDGSVIEPIHSFARIKRRVAREQRKFARKQKGSKNRAKQLRKLSKLRRNERYARQNFLHKASTEIARAFGTVVMEKLAVSQMSQSASGTKEVPGKCVKAKTGLNRVIRDQGWYMFRFLLTYKLAERGGVLVLVSPNYTSQRCAACGHTEAGNRKNQAVFACQSCGHKEHADLNAAWNILEKGHVKRQELLTPLRL